MYKSMQRLIRLSPLAGLTLLAGLFWCAGCSRNGTEGGDASANNGSNNSPQAESFPSGPVELQVKWPVGNGYLQRMDLEQSSSMKLPQREAPMKQDVTLIQDYAITVTGTHGASGRVLSLEYVKAQMDILVNGRTLLAYDSTAEQSEDAQNPLAPLLNGMMGESVKLYLDDQMKLERVEGLEALRRRMSTSVPQQTSALMTNMFGEETFRQMVELGRGLPGRAVEPGDTWKASHTIGMGAMGEMNVDLDYRFADWTKREGRTCARLEFSGTLTMVNEKATGPMGMRMAMENGTMNGETWFDPDLGMTVASRVDQAMTMTMTADIPRIGDKGGGTQTFVTDLVQSIEVELVELTTP